jgi:GT2 family glycosyltransferase
MVVMNCLDYTQKAIASIKTKHPYKLRIIDQASTDETVKWCRENNIDCYTKTPRVSLSEAWNFAIQESLKDQDCEYIFCPNNDVLFHPDTIDNLVDSIIKTGYIMVTGNNVAPLLASDRSFENYKNIGTEEEDYRPITDWREHGPDFSCWMVKRDFTKQVGWFDENFMPAFYEDNDMHLRILRLDGVAKRISRSPYYHYGSMTAKINSISSSRSRNVFLEKWGAMPAECMDGKGHPLPYNGNKDYKYWRGNHKYGV